MSIALEKGNGIGGPGFVRGIAACCPIYEVPEPAGKPSPATDAAEEKAQEESCSSSSIGRNSSAASADGVGSAGEEESGEAEVQSRLKGPFETLDALEDSLPMRRSISKFYSGKSKSFSSLSEAVALSSAKDLAKQENAYTRKRKNLLAFSIISDKFSNKGQTIIDGGISKKLANSSRSTFIPAGSNSMGDQNQYERVQCRPPRHPQGKSALPIPAVSPLSSSPREKFFGSKRSFSLTDLSHSSSLNQFRQEHQG